MDILLQVLINILSISNLLAGLVGVFVGIIIGALPGLGPTMAIALCLPFTFYMLPLRGISLLLGIYCGGIYGGSISAILINVPGSAASTATILDGRPMALQGRAGKALYASLLSSVVGGLFSGIVLLVGAPSLAKIAIKFGPVQYLGLIIFALTIISGVSQRNLFKGLSAASIGVLLSLVGTDPIYGNLRFTFNFYSLYGGLPFIPFLIGIFGLSEVLIQSEIRIERGHSAQETLLPPPKAHDDTVFTLVELMKYRILVLKSAVIGTFIGILPGIGASVSPFISYSEAQRSAKNPENFGKGDVRGVIAAETANNAVTGGALVPLLTLGIPGDTVTAVLFGALLMKGLIPGPLLFTKQTSLVFSIFGMFIVIQFLMLALGYLVLKYGARYIFRVPRPIIFSIVVILSVIGTFAVQNNLFDVAFMIFSGIIGYLLRKFDFPLAAVIIAFMLGGKLEISLRQSLLLFDNKWGLILKDPIFVLFLVFSIVSIVFFWIQGRRIANREG